MTETYPDHSRLLWPLLIDIVVIVGLISFISWSVLGGP